MDDSNCLHDIVWAGMCAQCGKSITSNTGVPFSSVFVSEREAKRQQEDTERRLLSSNKLGLVLDLDHTLLHATTEQFVKELPKEKDVFEFTLPPIITKYYLKLRYSTLSSKNKGVKIKGLGYNHFLKNFINCMKCIYILWVQNSMLKK